MKVKDIMTAKSLKTCTPESKLTEVANIMKTYNCGALPVVDQENKVLGIITDRDLSLSLASSTNQSLEQRKVKDIMSKNVYTVSSDDDINLAFQNMRKNQVGRLPVVDNTGKLSGIVSLHHLINQTVSEGNKEAWDVTAPGENLLKTIQAVTNRYNNNKPLTPSSIAAE